MDCFGKKNKIIKEDNDIIMEIKIKSDKKTAIRIGSFLGTVNMDSVIFGGLIIPASSALLLLVDWKDGNTIIQFALGEFHSDVYPFFEWKKLQVLIAGWRNLC